MSKNLMPQGTYKSQIVNIDLKSVKDHEILSVHFKIAEGDFKGKILSSTEIINKVDK